MNPDYTTGDLLVARLSYFPDIEVHQNVSSHAQIWTQGFEKQQIEVKVVVCRRVP